MFTKYVFNQFWWSSYVTSNLTSLWVKLIVSSFFVNHLPSLVLWLFDIWHLFDNLTSFWQFHIFLTFCHLFDNLTYLIFGIFLTFKHMTYFLNHLCPSQGYFLWTSSLIQLFDFSTFDSFFVNFTSFCHSDTLDFLTHDLLPKSLKPIKMLFLSDVKDISHDKRLYLTISWNSNFVEWDILHITLKISIIMLSRNFCFSFQCKFPLFWLT